MKNLFWGLSLAVTALLAACSSGSGTNGDPSENSSNSSSGADLFAETFDDLPVCTVNREGAIAYVKDEKAAYACEGGDWTLDDEDPSERKSNGDTGNDDSTYDVVTGTLTDSRDGQTYRTVKIGDQVWMAENLNFVTDNSWCYGDDPANCAKYGRLYTWAAAMSICPKGWHLPTKAEWEALIVAVDDSIAEYENENMAGTWLKSASGWKWDEKADKSGNGTDTYSFSALPAGHRNHSGNYYDESEDAGFWSSTEGDSGYAIRMYLFYRGDTASLFDENKLDGFSVRCLKD